MGKDSSEESKNSSLPYVQYEQKEYPARAYRPKRERNWANTPDAIEGDRLVSASGMERLEDDGGLGVGPVNTAPTGAASMIEEAVGPSIEHARPQQSEGDSSRRNHFCNIKFAMVTHQGKTYDEAYRDINASYTQLAKYIDLLQGLEKQGISPGPGLCAEYCLERERKTNGRI